VKITKKYIISIINEELNKLLCEESPYAKPPRGPQVGGDRAIGGVGRQKGFQQGGNIKPGTTRALARDEPPVDGDIERTLEEKVASVEERLDLIDGVKGRLDLIDARLNDLETTGAVAPGTDREVADPEETP